jgi:hypothetical protein
MLPTPLLIAAAGGPSIELEASRAEDAPGFVVIVDRLRGGA